MILHGFLANALRSHAFLWGKSRSHEVRMAFRSEDTTGRIFVCPHLRFGLVFCQRFIPGLSATGFASDFGILALIVQQRRTLAKPAPPQIQAVTMH